MSVTSFLFAALLLLAAWKLLYNALTHNKRSRLPYPPGPKPTFLIGNILDLPKGDACRKYTEWSKKFGSDILHAAAFGMHVIVINSRKVADELFERRSGRYDDRPAIPVAKIAGWDTAVGLLRYGDIWRQHRRLCQQNFNPDAAKQYQPIQQGCVQNFLHGVLHEPEKIFELSSLLAISVTMLMMYGYAPDTLDDQLIKAAAEGARLIGSLLDLDSTLINILPFLRYIPAWVPGAASQNKIKRLRFLTKQTKRIPWEHAMAAMREGTASASLVTNFLEKEATSDASPEEKAAVDNVAWTVYGAASDEIISATSSFLYFIVTHPEVQRRAQHEIELITDNSRLPNFDDRPHLPYIDAIYREVLRCHPPLPLALPHALTEDDVYDGYFLPKGATIIANIWAMTHDESVYPDPFAFKPERFLTSDGKLNDDTRVLAYGFGKRVCAGKSVASSTLWLIIVSFLACFDISKAKDEFGKEIEIDASFTEIGASIHLKAPFKCSITPRSEQMQKIIEGCH